MRSRKAFNSYIFVQTLLMPSRRLWLQALKFTLSIVITTLIVSNASASPFTDSVTNTTSQPLVAMSGIYTVNPAQPATTTNFIRIGQADTALMNNGIAGPVVIQIYNGIYSQVNMNLGVVAGTSSTNTITFTSFSNDSIQVQITNTLSFFGTSNIIIRKLNIDQLIINAIVSDYVISNNQIKTFKWVAGDNITFINNYIKPLGTLSFGSKSGSYIQNVKVEGNIFNQLTYYNLAGIGTTGTSYGVNWSKVRKPSLRNNTFNNINMTNVGYGLIGCCTYTSYPVGSTFQFDNCTDTAFVESNIFQNIHTDRLVHDIDLSNQNISTSRLSGIVIRNNFFTVYDQLSMSPYAQGACSIQFYHNNVNNIGNGTGPLLENNINLMKNNVFSSTNGKRAFTYFSHPYNSDYNCFYTTGNVLVVNNIMPTSYNTLAQYQAATGTNANSKNINPKYYDSLNLHERHPLLIAAGIQIPAPYALIRDIDNDNRNQLNPCIGADEFQVASADVIASQFTSPKKDFSALSPLQLKMKFTNNGSAVLNQVNVRWTVDGVAQTPYSWAGSLPYDSTAEVTFGSFSFPMLKYSSLKIWTDLPNGVPDMVPSNDTLRIDSIMPLANGNFTLGGTSPSFTSFGNASELLSYSGVDGAVNIFIRNGKYTEQPIISFIRGASIPNTVTFKGESGTASADTLTFNSTGTGNSKYATLRLDSAAFITFRNITFQSISAYSRQVEFANKSRFITFDSSVFTAVSTGTQYPQVDYDNSFNVPIDSNVIFTNNSFRNGSVFCINLPLKNGIIKGNRFDNLYPGSSTGVAINLTGTFTGTNNLLIDSNFVNNPLACTFLYGVICISYGYNSIGGISVSTVATPNNISITRNIINVINKIGITVTSNGTSSSPIKIYNNFITNRISGTALYTSGSFLDIAHNSFADSINNASLNLVEIRGNNTTFKNNLLTKGAGGAMPSNTTSLLYISSSSISSFVSSNNAYSINDTSKAISNNGVVMGLGQWKALSGKDINSVKTTIAFVNPASNLHINKNLAGAVDIAKKGIPLANVPNDIDDSTRSALTPCIGADEFTLNAVDGGALAITAPGFPLPLGNSNVVASIRNFGNNSITTASVNWSVNSVTQTPYNYSGSLASGDSAVNLQLGVYNFSSAIKYDIKVWTGNVNGGSDVNPLNDTASRSVYPALCGTYTVAGNTPDFPALKNALNYIASSGMTCPVVFNIRDGQYNEADTISAIIGSSAVNTLTIQSESLDSSKVTLYQSDYVTGTPGVILRIDNAKNVTIKNIGIKRIASSPQYYFDIIGLSNDPSGLTIKNCEFVSTGAGTILAFSAPQNPVISNINISNNNFVGGVTAINISGNYYSNLRGLVIRNNNFRKPYSPNYGNTISQITLAYLNNLVFDNNYLDSTSQSTGFVQGLSLQNSSGKISISGNKIIKRKGASGINMYYVNGLNYSDSAVVIANNFIAMDSVGNNAALSCNSMGRNVKVLYNNILNNCYGTSLSSYALYFTNNFGAGTFRDTIANNNIIVTGTGYAFYQYQNSAGDENCTNNNIWSSSASRLATYNSSQYNTISALALASGTNTASVSMNPGYVNNTDLHITELALRTLGKPFSYIPTDIDGDLRSTVNPTIGADEIVVSDNDAGITAIVSPAKPFAPGNQNVAVTLKNYGNFNLTGATINWSVNGNLQAPYTFAGSVPFNTTTNVAIGNVNFVVDSAFVIKAWTSSPNGGIDGNANNDTFQLGNIYAALNGTYTLGGVSPNFKSFSRSSNNLKYGGMLGNVIFNVRDGRYNEAMFIDSIPFQNSFTATWQGESGDSSKPVLAYTSVLNDNIYGLLQLNNAKNIIFKKLTLQIKLLAAYSPTYSSLVYLSKKNKNIQFVSNQFVDSTYNVYAGSNVVGSRFFYNKDVAASSPNVTARSADSLIVIDNNLFRQVNQCTNGVIDLGGSTTSDFSGNVTVIAYLNNLLISNNKYNMSLLGKPGIDISYTDSLRLLSNKLTGNITVSGNNLLIVDRNDIYHEGTGQVAFTVNSYTGRPAGKPAIISNNMIQTRIVGNSNGVPVNNTALYVTGDRVNIIHNTLMSSDTGCITGYNFGVVLSMFKCVSDTVKNNILYNSNGGYLMGHNTVSGLVSNGNNYFYTNHFSFNANNLAQFRTVYGQDPQSVENIQPYFRGPKDLHASNIQLKAAAATTPTTGYYLTDFDGQARGVIVCYGADEFLQPVNDMIVLDASPKKIFPEGTNDIKIRVYNNGSNPISSFSATASVVNYPDGYTPVTTGSISYNYSGNIAPGAQATITLGQMNVPLYRNQFKVNTYNLNGVGDEVNYNDSLQNDNLYCGLNGTYTMRDYGYQNSAVATFSSFSIAATQLKFGGVYGPSTLNLLPGLWDAAFYADSIPNRGSLSPLTIASQNGDSSTTGFNVNYNHAFTIYKANNVMIRNLFFGSPNTDPTYSSMILGYNSQNITVQNCRFSRMSQITNNVSLSNCQLIIGTNWSGQTGYTDSNYVVKNNFFSGAYRGLYIFGSDVKPARNFDISKNTFSNQGSFGMDIQLIRNTNVDSNTIRTTFTDPAYYGINAESLSGKNQFTKNRVYIENDGTGIKTLESFLPPYAVSDTFLIANNFVTTGRSIASIAMDLSVTRGAKIMRVLHNSMLNRSNNTGAISLKTNVSNVGGKFEVLNNIMYNKTAGLALSVTRDVNMNYVQHNEDLFTAGSILAQANGTNYNSLPALAASGIEYSSVSGNPLYLSDSDLHVDGALVNNTGSIDARSSVATDIDNEQRSNSTPDIGADEFNLPNFGAVQLETPTNSCSHTSAETVKAWIKNYGSAPRTNVPVAYRVNSGTIVRDTVRAIINPGDSVLFTFTTTANLSTPTNYYFDVWTAYRGDSLPSNDTLKQVLVATTPVITALPYYTGFEGTNAGWYTGGQNSSFRWGVIYSGVIDSAANGLNAWKTNLTGPYNNNENSFLYSPCYDFTSVTTDPTLNFNLAFQLESNIDKAWLEYSSDAGNTWIKLGVQGEGLAWYNNANNYWTGLYKTWHNAKHTLPISTLPDRSHIRLRFVMQTNSAVVQDGIAIDDISIYTGNNPPVSAGTYTNLTATSTGTSTFIPVNDPSGNRVVEINDNGQNLGNITVDVNQNNGGTPTSFGGTTYLGRSWVIHVQNAPTTPVRVRLYFTQAEVDAWRALDPSIDLMRNIAVYKFSGNIEDFSLANNTAGTSLTLAPAQLVKVPYLDGYFMEFSVSSFSEFWLTKVAPIVVLPVTFESINAVIQEENALVTWRVSNEINVSHYNVLRSGDGTNYLTVGRVDYQRGSGVYSFFDLNIPEGKNYYRIQQVDENLQQRQSVTVSVIRKGNMKIRIYPTIFTSTFKVDNQTGKSGEMSLFTPEGKLVLRSFIHTGSNIINGSVLSKGSYYYSIRIADAEVNSGKLLKE